MMKLKLRKLICDIIVLFVAGVLPSLCAAKTLYVSSRENGSDFNDGTEKSPVKSAARALSFANPGDTVVFAVGTYPVSNVQIPDGKEDLPIILRASETGKVIFTNDGHEDILKAGSYNTIDGIEFKMTSLRPAGSGVSIVRKEHVTIQNSRFFSCDVGVYGKSSKYLSITNSEMSFSGHYGVHLDGSDDGNPSDENRFVEVRNCYMHDAGWNTEGTEGYGFTANGAIEDLIVENNQFDNNSGDGILYEDWGIHTTARYNVIRGSGIAGVWIDNASMGIVESNYLEQNNVAIWLSGEPSTSRFRNDLMIVRNNIIVHNDWHPFDPTGVDKTVYGRAPILISQSTEDAYFDNNTIAFNQGDRLVSLDNRTGPEQDKHDNLWFENSNVWFRNNIFWKNQGTVGAVRDLSLDGLRFENNLWDQLYSADHRAISGDPMFVDPAAHDPEGYRIQSNSAARAKGLFLPENHFDFWGGMRPHLSELTPDPPGYKPDFSRVKKTDVGAHQFGSAGTEHIGLDRKTFPFEVPPYKLQFKARPPGL